MTRNYQENNETLQASEAPSETTEIETAMDTGQGADDEPEMTIGDRFGTSAPPLDTEEAEQILGLPHTSQPSAQRNEP